MGGFAWVTLATNDSYSLGALVLAHSLRKAGTKHDLAVLITPGVTQVMRDKLATVFSLVQEVNVLDSKEEANLALLARPELGITFTKLHCWRLTQYEKCVFIDADALVIRNCDELFDREELSAAPDVGWPDCFNSGVFVFKPSQQTFASITSFAAEKGSFDGGDQGLLNSYFSDWAHKDISKHLPFIYNMCSTATYSYLPAYKQYGENARIIHFIGATKPWLQYFDTETGVVHPPSGCNHLQPLLQLWWNIFCDNVHSQLSPVMAGIAGALAKMTLGEPRSCEQVALEEHMRRQGWEQGQIDYMGKDSFENIWKKILNTLSEVPPSPSTPQQDEESSPPKEEQISTPETESSTISDVTPATEASPTIATETKLDTELPSRSSDYPDAPILPDSEIQTSESDTIIDQTIDNIKTTVNDEKKEEIETEVKVESSKLETEINKDEEKSIPASEILSPEEEIVLETTQSSDIKEIDDEKEVEEPEVTEKSFYQVSSASTGETIPSGDTKVSNDEPGTLEESIIKAANELSELISESNSVPIQVAESVLQSEPKESVSEVQSPISEEIISSVVVAPVLESVTAVSETLGDGSIEPEEQNGDNGNEEIENGVDCASESKIPETQSDSTSAVNETGEISTAVLEPEVKESAPQILEEKKIEEENSQVPIEQLEDESPESVAASESSKSASLTPPESPITEVPVRPARTRDPRIPTTPIITEATPPNSPPIGSEQNLEDQPKPKIVKKVVKKIVKKIPEDTESGELEAGAEGETTSGKKIVKKVVKKVIKKPKETPGDDGVTPESSQACEKPKKVVKIVKKIVKPSESLEVDNSVPETPPAGVPVPPKRKTKTTTTTTTTTKTTTTMKNDDQKTE